MNSPSIVMLAVCSLALTCGCAKQNEYQPPPPPDVRVAKPLIQSVNNYVEETGTAEAAERVEIRARVKGYLEKIEFQDGQEITQGDPLYVIQKSEYEAAFQQAEANVKTSEVEVRRAEIEYNRQKKLFEENATSQTKLVQAEADYNSALAQNQQSIAAKDRAQLDLDYCEIRSPITGRVERTQVKRGNLVGDDGATQLTTVISYDPIHVYFSISERTLLQAEDRTPRDPSTGEKDLTQVKAYLKRALDKDFPFEGHLDYADLGVDQSTGTFTVRAIFDNPDNRIYPGLFVRIRVAIGRSENAVLVPERCIGFDQGGRFVLIVGDENKVERRNVEVGPKFEDMVVIISGLSGEETVVIDGIQKARPGNPVNPESFTLEPVKDTLEHIAEGDVGDENSSADPDEAAPANDAADAATTPAA